MATILVVDDDVSNRDVVATMLKLGGYHSIEARTGREALRLATTETPDLILMDMSMPDLDGWNATSQLKADQRLAHIPVIALTAHAMTGDAERARAAGCDDYLSKPVDYFDLLRTIAAHLPAAS